MKGMVTLCSKLGVKILFPQSNPGYPVQSGRKMKITWCEMEKNPLDIIYPMFFLDVPIEDPIC